MRDQPSDLRIQDLAGALRDRWRVEVSADDLTYAPLGFGDHHWTARDADGGRWFVTVSDLRAGGTYADLEAAMDTAAALADGLGFVVPPLRTSAGDTLRPLGERYAVALFPYVEGEAGDFDDTLTPAQAGELAAVLARLHRFSPAPAGTPVQPLSPGGRPVLAAALGELDAPWSGGPFAEPARALLADLSAGVRRSLDRFDRMAADVRGLPRAVTHGEPHPGNLLRAEGGLLLIDWDTVALAPPERDLWLLDRGGAGHGVEAYAAATGHRVSRPALAFYRLRWHLDDIGVFLREFRAPHRRGPDTELAWSGFAETLERVAADAS